VSEPITSAIKPRSVEAMAAREVRRVQLAGVVALLALAAIVALSWALQRPPTPVLASAPSTEFSAQRAYVDLQRIAGPEPTPIGSVGLMSFATIL
jgi:hypothetical protein